eukprot:symbB.v1.2.019167.t1/scaffold1555.1/size186957/21
MILESAPSISRSPEAEVLTNQLRSTLKKKEVEIERLESQDAASAREVESILKELEDAKRSRIDAEDKVAKVLAEDATLREELERFEANASAEASRSSRLDGHCSVLEVESRTLRDELASSSNVHDDLQQATEQLRRELAAKDQQLAQLQSQLQRLSDESQDFQAQRDYALSELKAANQVAEALKSTSTVLDKRRKPRRCQAWRRRLYPCGFCISSRAKRSHLSLFVKRFGLRMFADVLLMLACFG